MQVPRVPGHQLELDNRCQASVLRKRLDANRPNFLKILKILLIASVTHLSFWENRTEAWEFFELGKSPPKVHFDKGHLAADSKETC